MIRRTLFATLGVAALFIVGAASAFAWSGDVQGNPNLNHDSPVGYYLWHDDNGLHVWTHGPGDEHLFTARLRTDGVFTDVNPVRLESVDSFAVLDGGHTLVLRFHTYNATDGVNFRVDGGTRMHLNLRLDQEPIATDSIFLGAERKHPDSNPFVIRR